MKRTAIAILCVLGAWSTPSGADAPERPLDTGRSDVAAFIAQVSQRSGLDPDYLAASLAEARIQPRILEAISRPAERVKPWYEYREIFLTDSRIAAGEVFWSEHREILDAVSSRTGVPASVIVGIIGVETFYGRITGSYRVLDALATLAFEYPPRGSFFGKELEQFFLMAREQSLDPTEPTGSYAGAMGLAQFIPSSYRAYAIDGDGDGRVDLWGSIPDAVASVANYLAVHGWRPGKPVVAVAVVPDNAPGGLVDQGLSPTTTVGALWDAGVGFAGPAPEKRAAPAGLFMLEKSDGPAAWAGFSNFYVITRYNRSLMYALAVSDLGRAVHDRVMAADAE